MPETLSRPAELFWAKTKRDEETGCLLWTGTRRGRPPFFYGAWSDQGRYWIASRAAWVYAHGPIPKGKDVLHRCDTPLCVDPECLFLGTAKSNAEDRDAKGRHNPVRGEKHCCAKLTDKQVAAIRAARGVTQQALADRYGVRQSQISRIRAGNRRAA